MIQPSGFSGTHRNVLPFEYNMHILTTQDNTTREIIL